jgi:hypothetical protein
MTNSTITTRIGPRKCRLQKLLKPKSGLVDDAGDES